MQLVGSGMEWSFADVGYDTSRKLWFIAFQRADGHGVATVYGPRMILKGVTGYQYEWPTEKGEGWHVRERVFSGQLDRLLQDEQGTLTVLGHGPGHADSSAPTEFDYLEFAWHLKSGVGFIDFFKDGVAFSRLEKRSLTVESLNHETTGTYPAIRLRAQRADVREIVLTRTCAIIVGTAELGTAD
jgi:hypothetical protein